ncbi:hypothetical protein BJ741DRAFT_50516 [Chytriomyces cf. hyalinus JEL632]|nr:hypothetical protein BJ741DRAFT_50516 [Chytriomyces cf. hyalinus JEL632]
MTIFKLSQSSSHFATAVITFMNSNAYPQIFHSRKKTNPTSAMWTQYTHFLTETLSSVTEFNLQRYIFVILSKAYKRAHSLNSCTPTMYISWSRLHNHDSKAKLDILDQALLVPEHERSGLLWAAKLNETMQSVPETTSIEEVEALVTRALQLVGKPKSSAASESNTLAAAAASKLFDLKTERFEIWKLYLEWAASENGGGANKNDETRVAALERRFRDCLSVQELGGTSVDTAEFEAYIVGVYLDWSFTVGGIERVRSASDRLLSFKQRSTFFLNLVLEFEERHILQGSEGEFGGVGALVEAAKRSMKSLVTPTQLTRLRKLHELVCFSDAGRIGT